MTKRKRPQVRVTLSTFDTRDPLYRSPRVDVPIDEFVPIEASEYLPSGGTPLRDAVGRFVGHLEQLRSDDTVTVGLLLDESGSMSDRRGEVIESTNQFVDGLRGVGAVDPGAAGTVLCVIATDGYENSSREIDQPTLQKLVASKESDGFTMIFLGSAIDAWAQGSNLGLSGGAAGQTVSYSGRQGSHTQVMCSVTNDAQAYLSDVNDYKQHRAVSSMRSVTDDGEEVLSNINAGS